MSKLLKIRQERGITQEFIADNIGVSNVAYHLYETGQRKIPLEKAEKIAEILNININDFLTPSSFSLR